MFIINRIHFRNVQGDVLGGLTAAVDGPRLRDCLRGGSRSGTVGRYSGGLFLPLYLAAPPA